MAARVTRNTKGRTGRWGGGRYAPRRKVCYFCSNHIKEIGYKDIPVLVKYISDRAKIEPRRRTGTCARHQRALALAIKRARHLVLLPFAPEHIHRVGKVSIDVPVPKIEPKPPEDTAAEAVGETA